MPISSPFILQTGQLLLDLRKVSSWWDTDPQTSPPTVQIRMIDTPRSAIQVNKALFESQQALSLAAGG